jgi:hypothetical protein
MRNPERSTPILESNRPRKPGRLRIATKAEAVAMDEQVLRIVGEIKSNWLRLGRLVQNFRETRAFEALGFPNFNAWMKERLGASLSNAFSALRSVRALEGVSEEKLKRIGERNAHLLTYLPEKKRKSEEWLEKAATLPTKEFKHEIETARGLSRDGFKTFSIALPDAVYESVIQAEKKIAWSLGIDIETKPGNRIQVWEALAQWIILQTDEQTIRTQTEGV